MVVEHKTESTTLPIEYLVPGRYQARKNFCSEHINALATSIKRLGVVVPISVRKLDHQRYEILAGEQRWRGAQLAGLHEVPVMIHDCDDEAAAEISLIENIIREDLNPIEEAEGFQQLVDEFGYTHQAIADAVSKDRTSVTAILGLLRLEPSVQTLLREGVLSEGHGKVLISLSSHQQCSLAAMCVKGHWSVHRLSQERALLLKQSSTSITPEHNGADVSRLETHISELLGAKTTIAMQSLKKGQLRITFHSLDELDGVLAKLGYHES